MEKTATWHWTVDPTTEQGKACKRWDEAKENFIAIDGTVYPIGHKFEGDVMYDSPETIAEAVQTYGEEEVLKLVDKAVRSEALNTGARAQGIGRQPHQASLGYVEKAESKLEVGYARIAEKLGKSIEEIREIATA